MKSVLVVSLLIPQHENTFLCHQSRPKCYSEIEQNYLLRSIAHDIFGKPNPSPKPKARGCPRPKNSEPVPALRYKILVASFIIIFKVCSFLCLESCLYQSESMKSVFKHNLTTELFFFLVTWCHHLNGHKIKTQIHQSSLTIFFLVEAWT